MVTGESYATLQASATSRATPFRVLEDSKETAKGYNGVRAQEQNQSSEKSSPSCEHPIPPEIRRVDFERMQCVKRGAVFAAKAEPVRKAD
jgi:hypothetical protein